MKLKLRCRLCKVTSGNETPVTPTEDSQCGDWGTYSGLYTEEPEKGDFWLNLDGWTCPGIDELLKNEPDNDAGIEEHTHSWYCEVDFEDGRTVIVVSVT